MNRLFPFLVLLGCTLNAHADEESSTAFPATENFPSMESFFPEEWIADKLSLRFHNEQYAWSGNNASGWQNITPITATYHLGNVDLGLRTAYIFSENTSPNRRGYVNTLSDTAFSFAYTQLLSEDWDIRFNLDYNAPTGKATLSGSERNAIMNGNLVQQTRFGEGHNVTPGVVLTKSFGKDISVGIGLSYTIRGSFDPNALQVNDRFNPGDETRASVQGKYGTENWLLIGGLIFTKSQTTVVNHQSYFRKGQRFDVNLSSVYSLSDEQKLSGSFRYALQSRDTYINSITGNFEKETRNINGDSVYLSLEYAKTFFSKHTVRVQADWLRVNKNSYDQLNDLYYAGRQKWQLGLAYDYQIDSKKRLHLLVKNMAMNEKATPLTRMDTHYNGWTISSGFDWSF